ncbi:MAG: ATP synthase F1 subunit epsilon [Cyclobacteriaceae bacterium]
MFLEIYTPDKKVFEGEVDATTLPGIDGSLQILNNHAPLICPLGKGDLRYQKKKDDVTMTVEGGVVEVLNNKVTVLAESITE